MATLSLVRARHPLSDPALQRDLLDSSDATRPFDVTLEQHALPPLQASGIQVLQVNLGRLCNQTCVHCHVDAGPDRREIMTRETMEQCLTALAQYRIPVLDITGGAPEMNPDFRWFVEEARRLGCRVIDRCNLTILVAPGFEDLPEFLATCQVELVASLPCYLQENVDAQRGDGVFDRSIDAIRRLNSVGYGIPGSGLTLALVFNPQGPTLPPSQTRLEAEYRRKLLGRYGIVFNCLYCMTNMPISRFLASLVAQHELDNYLQTLASAFNPAGLSGLMCRTMVSVDWRGELYDCDFNQMLGMKIARGRPHHIRDFNARELECRPIETGRHCYGCTAGAGSSCCGETSPPLAPPSRSDS